MTPKYYIGKTLKIEAKDVVMDFQADNYNLGTALTYLMRAGKKPHNPICDDIRKAIAHLQFELERQNEQPTISSNKRRKPNNNRKICSTILTPLNAGR
jgi:hypothetical protein